MQIYNQKSNNKINIFSKRILRVNILLNTLYCVLNYFVIKDLNTLHGIGMVVDVKTNCL